MQWLNKIRKLIFETVCKIEHENAINIIGQWITITQNYEYANTHTHKHTQLNIMCFQCLCAETEPYQSGQWLLKVCTPQILTIKCFVFHSKRLE